MTKNSTTMWVTWCDMDRSLNHIGKMVSCRLYMELELQSCRFKLIIERVKLGCTDPSSEEKEPSVR